MSGYNRVLGKSFEGALGQVQRKVVLTHKQRVTRLYRQSLRTLNSWVVDRAIWCKEAAKIRAQFDKHKGLSRDSGYVHCPVVGRQPCCGLPWWHCWPPRLLCALVAASSRRQAAPRWQCC